MSAATEWEAALDAIFSHFETGQLERAEDLCRRFLEKSPEHPEVLHYLGLIRFELGGGEPALKLMQRSAALDPKRAEVHFDLGNALLALGRSREAIDSYGQAIACP
jgi:Flp pilus assembly protein TadD